MLRSPRMSTVVDTGRNPRLESNRASLAGSTPIIVSIRSNIASVSDAK